MKNIYTQIWGLAKPYYKKGRPMDIDHIEWMMHDALLACKKEKIDDSIFLPLVILHDVGYAKVPKDDPMKLNMRKAHMREGAKLARAILEKVSYPESKIKQIEYYVSIHDNWALGDNDVYRKHDMLRVFTDLDYIWMATPEGFPALCKILGKSRKEMLEYLLTNDKLKLRPFSTKTTKQLYEKYLCARKMEIKPE